MRRLAQWFAAITLAALLAPVAGASGELLTLEDGQGLRATLAPAHGGELAGLEVRRDGCWYELLYRARDYTTTGGWRGKAPLLWPAVGPTVDPADGRRGFHVDNTFYPMPAHGFARELAWRVLDRGRDHRGSFAVLGVSSAARTRRHYPFDFELEAEYRLAGGRLELTYTVRADSRNAGDMPFSIGNHITFRAPLLPGAPPASLRFSNDFPEYLLRNPDRTFSGRVAPSPYRGEHEIGTLPRRSAVGLGGGEGTAELAVLDPSGLVVRLSHAADREPTAPAIRFNLWADTEEGFFSPEPWLGTQNSLNNGAGLIRLAPGDAWRWRLTIEPGWLDPATKTGKDESP